MNTSRGGLVSFSVLVGALVIGFAVAVQPFGLARIASGCVGLLAVVLAGVLSFYLQRVQIRPLLAGLAGLLCGSLLGLTFALIAGLVYTIASPANTFFRLVIPALLASVGLLTGILKSADFPLPVNSGPDPAGPGKILDTSVLIDGRIFDVAASGFLEGTLVIPRFVLHELQVIADSADSARRARGRRGLDVVQQLQNYPELKVEISAQDFTATREVDLKLIELAKLRKAKIVTNDFNLNKLAQVQGVDVLNVNQLANSLKPIVLPGEGMRVFIIKEGKEYSQGIAYLDDGTMVVVDNARRMISKTIDITVTSVLQTTAGKMIFGRYDERSHSEARPLSASASS